MLLMRLGAVLIAAGGMVRNIRARMRRHSRATVKHLYCGSRGAHFHLLLCERIGHAVEVSVDFNVIVDVDASLFPLAILIALGRQRAQRGSIHGFEQALARTFAFAERALVEPRE